jgi:hypothetical protein
LKPLPYPEPERIVRVRQVGANGNAFSNISEPNFSDLREACSIVRGARPLRYRRATGVGRQRADARLDGERLGRVLRRRRHSAARRSNLLARRACLRRHATVSSGYSYWQRYFGGDPAYGERTLRIADRSYAIVGVMPPGFDYPDGAEVWTPAELWP